MDAVKNIAVIVNPIAGSGRSISLSKEVVSRLEKHTINYHLFSDNWPQNFNSFTDVWIVGGDGTLNFFVNQYPNINLPLVIFKGGSGNDFHWMLYKDKTTDQHFETALYGETKMVDAGICNGKLFINCAGAGFDGAVVKKLSGKIKKAGIVSYYKAVFKNIFFYKEQVYRLDINGSVIEGRFLIVSIMNAQRFGGGFRIAPEASITDGLLEIILIRPLGLFKRLRFLPTIEKGNYAHLPFIINRKASAIMIRSDHLLDAQLDGEYFSANKIEINLIPKKFLFRF